MNKIDEEYLEHVGVKGMKWGQRRARSGPGLSGKLHKLNIRLTEKAIKRSEGNIKTYKKMPFGSSRVTMERIRAAELRSKLKKLKRKKMNEVKADQIRAARKIVGRILSTALAVKTLKEFYDITEPSESS